jgi:hypothetical protein
MKRFKAGFQGGASGGMGLEVGCPTSTDHVAGNAAVQKTSGGADHPVALRPVLPLLLHTPRWRDAAY